MKAIYNTEDIIDSRDIIERIEYLQGSDDKDELEELAALERVAQKGEDYSPDWRYGEALIRDSYFKEYAQELAEDIGAISNDQSWPNTCIDWDQAARELQMDYTCVDFDGAEYWIRS